jgi:hypothetical protein
LTGESASDDAAARTPGGNDAAAEGEAESDAKAPDPVGVTTAVERLREHDAALADALLAVFEAVVAEAARSRRFADALRAALDQHPGKPEAPSTPRSRKSTTRASKLHRPSNRRAPGVIDPFAVYAEGGDDKLRTRLRTLGLEQLRDIVAEHGMDNDRLAMKWKDEERVIGRIVDRVVARSDKGFAFRDPS